MLTDRLAALAWPDIEAQLLDRGFALLKGVLSPDACRDLAARYDEDALYRSRVVMARHSFGSGEYRYFADPLPEPVATLRRELYAGLAPIANRFNALTGAPRRYPAEHEAFRAECRAGGQTRPTPLLLRYRAGDYNRLHQDLYGALVFPLQAVVLLSEPGRDFTGGALVLTEQRARMQSRAEVLAMGQGDMAIFAVRERPATGPRGVSRAVLRHGVSTVTEGERHALGVIFHDAA